MVEEKNIAVVGNKVIVDPAKEGESETEHGIILPDSMKDIKHNGVVMAVGPEADKRIKKGTMVIYDTKAGSEVIVNKKNRVVMRDVDLLYFFEESSN